MRIVWLTAKAKLVPFEEVTPRHARNIVAMIKRITTEECITGEEWLEDRGWLLELGVCERLPTWEELEARATQRTELSRTAWEELKARATQRTELNRATRDVRARPLSSFSPGEIFEHEGEEYVLLARPTQPGCVLGVRLDPWAAYAPFPRDTPVEGPR